MPRKAMPVLIGLGALALVVLALARPAGAGRTQAEPEVMAQIAFEAKTVPAGSPLTVTLTLTNSGEVTAAVRLTTTLGGLGSLSDTLRHSLPASATAGVISDGVVAETWGFPGLAGGLAPSGTATLTFAALAPAGGAFTVGLQVEDQARVYSTTWVAVTAVQSGWALSVTAAGDLSWPAGISATSLTVAGFYTGGGPAGQVLIHCPAPEQSKIMAVTAPALPLCSALPSNVASLAANGAPLCAEDDRIEAVFWTGDDVAPGGGVSFSYDMATTALSDLAAGCYLYDLAAGAKIASGVLVSVTAWRTRLPVVLHNWEGPAVAFEASPRSGPPPLTVTFTDTSSSRFGEILSRAWDLGDGGTSSVATPTHVYTKVGEYAVTLVVTDTAGSAGRVAVGLVRVARAPVVVTGTYKGFYRLTQTGQGVTTTNAGLGSFSIEWLSGQGDASNHVAELFDPGGNTWDTRSVAIFDLPPGAPEGEVIEGWIEYSTLYTYLETYTMAPPEAVPASYRQTNWTETEVMLTQESMKRLWFDVSPDGWEQAHGRPMSNCAPAKVWIPAGKMQIGGPRVGLMISSGATVRPELWIPYLIGKGPIPYYENSHRFIAQCTLAPKPMLWLKIQPKE